MNNTDELRHVKHGPTLDERPEGFLVSIHAVCEGNADEVAFRAREVMTILLEKTETRWPSLQEWRLLLPEWFMSACAPERSKEETDHWLRQWRQLSPAAKEQLDKEEKWELGNWIHWFEPQQKSWWWWDIATESAAKVSLTVVVEGWPSALGSAVWLLRASGAADASVEE